MDTSKFTLSDKVPDRKSMQRSLLVCAGLSVLAIASGLPVTRSNIGLRGGGLLSFRMPKEDPKPAPPQGGGLRASAALIPAVASSYVATQISAEQLTTPLAFGLQRWQVRPSQVW